MVLTSTHKKYIGVYLVLTSGGLVAVVPVPEILWVLDHWDTGHTDHHSVWPSVQGTRSYDAVIDVVEGAGRVFFTADHSHGSCREKKRAITQNDIGCLMENECSVIHLRGKSGQAHLSE